MRTSNAPGQPPGMAPPPPRRGGRRRRFAVAALALLLAAFCAATARVFIFPALGMPAHVNAIVMLAGRGNRYAEALKLAEQHRAPYLVISLGSPAFGPGGQDGSARCAPPVPRVRLICFAPSPATTQGEAEYVGRLAAGKHWHSIVLVTITPQASRARLRFGRCFTGHIFVMTGSMHAYGWPYEIAYEWAATMKALALQRSC